MPKIRVEATYCMVNVLTMLLPSTDLIDVKLLEGIFVNCQEFENSQEIVLRSMALVETLCVNQFSLKILEEAGAVMMLD